MKTNAKIGVFLCRCGKNIDPLVDLPALHNTICQDPDVTHCEIMSYPCQKPGIEGIMQAVAKNGLNRLIIAGCESRLMLKNFERQLEPVELRTGQIDMINLRGHIAAVSDLDPQKKAQKAAKLITAAVAEMAVLAPTTQKLAHLEGPVMIVGGGVSSFAAAQELDQKGIDFMLAVDEVDPEKVLRTLHHSYPGERSHYERVGRMVKKAVNSPHATILKSLELTSVSGVTGDYTLKFKDPRDNSIQSHKSGAIIACLDAELDPPGPMFGHDGQAVLTLSELEEHFWQKGIPAGQVVIWLSDYETGQPELGQLSARNAWAMARHISECSDQSRVIILYNEQMAVPLSASERALNRKLGILWIPYDKAVRPTVQQEQITFCNLQDHVEHEINWDLLVLSPERSVGGNGLKIAENLGLVHKKGHFLTGHHAKVRPEMVGREETYLAGSARYPCDLQEALTQGRRAADKTAEMLRKAAENELYLPRVVCVVDPAKCIGCGQCQELCECGGIGVADGPGGGLPRVVDPMVCTGGGTCAAACPYHALVLQNNSNDQREARVSELSRQMAADEVVAFACMWGGLPAADIAGKKGLKYDPRTHILGVPCVGQIDPCVMARAFLEGAPGLLLIGCLPEECHHSNGLDHAWSRVNVIKKILSLCGFDRHRIALSHADLNKPEEFIRTVEAFNQMIAALGPIKKTPQNISKLQCMYDLIKFNTRVRHLLSAGLRRPWEDDYRGDQRHALDYDRDFTAVLTEEFLQQRLLQVFKTEKKALNLNQLSNLVHEDEQQIVECLWDMVSTGVIDFSHKDREAFYALNN